MSTGIALRYVIYPMFDRLHSLILKCNLFMEGKEWSVFSYYIRACGQHTQLIRNILGSVVAVFMVTRMSSSRATTLELDEIGMTVNQAL